MVNSFLLFRRNGPFDPYPYILLNLVLSMLAAIQAPVIIMSQNRQAANDRANAEHDYQVNLKAELEIMSLHEKVDTLREKQWEELLAMQQEQIQILHQSHIPRQSRGLDKTVNRSKRLKTMSYLKVAILPRTFSTGRSSCPLLPVF